MDQPRPLGPVGAAVLAVVGWSLLWGLMIGLAAGAAAGTVAFPFFGTIYGGAIGMVVGLPVSAVWTIVLLAVLLARHRREPVPEACRRDIQRSFVPLTLGLLCYGVGLLVRTIENPRPGEALVAAIVTASLVLLVTLPWPTARTPDLTVIRMIAIRLLLLAVPAVVLAADDRIPGRAAGVVWITLLVLVPTGVVIRLLRSAAASIADAWCVQYPGTPIGQRPHRGGSVPDTSGQADHTQSGSAGVTETSAPHPAPADDRSPR